MVLCNLCFQMWFSVLKNILNKNFSRITVILTTQAFFYRSRFSNYCFHQLYKFLFSNSLKNLKIFQLITGNTWQYISAAAAFVYFIFESFIRIPKNCLFEMWHMFCENMISSQFDSCFYCAVILFDEVGTKCIMLFSSQRQSINLIKSTYSKHYLISVSVPPGFFYLDVTLFLFQLILRFFHFNSSYFFNDIKYLIFYFIILILISCVTRNIFLCPKLRQNFLLVARCLSVLLQIQLVAFCSLLVTFCSLLITFCPSLFIIFCSLLVTFCLFLAKKF